MKDRFIATIEHLSGRHVLAFLSNHHVGPDIEIELFMLTPDDTAPLTDASLLPHRPSRTS